MVCHGTIKTAQPTHRQRNYAICICNKVIKVIHI